MPLRVVKSSNDFFDILDKLKNNTFVCVGYVTEASLTPPQIKKKNPKTNRMKGYPDFSVFKQDGDDREIGALVKISAYNFRYYNRAEVAKQYDKIKTATNDIRAQFGLDPMQDRVSYKSKTSWSDNAPELYSGENQQKFGNSYNPQNLYGANVKSTTYAVDTNGRIMRALSDEEILPYLKAKKEVSGVAALRKMNAEESVIQNYIQQIQNLKFQYRNLESKSILWMAATVNNEKILYINDSLERAVEDINIYPSDFRKIAMDRYNVSLADLTECVAHPSTILKEISGTNKCVTRITESDLYSIIESTLKELLS